MVAAGRVHEAGSGGGGGGAFCTTLLLIILHLSERGRVRRIRLHLEMSVQMNFPGEHLTTDGAVEQLARRTADDDDVAK